MQIINTLFDLGVTEKGGSHIYTLYWAGMDDPIYEEESGSAWTSSAEALVQMGEHLAYKFCEVEGLVLMHAVAIVYRDWFEVKWWYEKPARDTTVQFTHQLNRPELLETVAFEFLIPKGSYSDGGIRLAHALMAFAALRGIHPKEDA